MSDVVKIWWDDGGSYPGGGCYKVDKPNWDGDVVVSLSDHESALSALREENERLRGALELALTAHGKMLLSDPPQDAWKYYRVEEKARAALTPKEQGNG